MGAALARRSSLRRAAKMRGALNGGADRWPDECRNFLKSRGASLCIAAHSSARALGLLWPPCLPQRVNCSCPPFVSLVLEWRVFILSFYSRPIIPGPFFFRCESLILLTRFAMFTSLPLEACFASLRRPVLTATSWRPFSSESPCAARWTRKRSDSAEQSFPPSSMAGSTHNL